MDRGVDNPGRDFHARRLMPPLSQTVPTPERPRTRNERRGYQRLGRGYPASLIAARNYISTPRARWQAPAGLAPDTSAGKQRARAARLRSG